MIIIVKIESFDKMYQILTKNINPCQKMDSRIKMTLECKFCNKTFSSVSSLNYHQKTAKYCLKIQQKTDEEVIKISFDCEYCKKEYPSKQRLKAHKENCLDKYKKIIKDQNDEMENKDKNHEKGGNCLFLDSIVSKMF